MSWLQTRLLDVCCGICLLPATIGLCWAPSAMAQDTGVLTEAPAQIIAAQIRNQGYACEAPAIAKRDEALSKPDLPVWILRCGNATYRVRLDADMAASVERLE
jgi:hypothetical protein